VKADYILNEFIINIDETACLTFCLHLTIMASSKVPKSVIIKRYNQGTAKS
jgi:hypothetical protein